MSPDNRYFISNEDSYVHLNSLTTDWSVLPDVPCSLSISAGYSEMLFFELMNNNSGRMYFREFKHNLQVGWHVGPASLQPLAIDGALNVSEVCSLLCNVF